jgi:hypothetical protein
VWPARKPQAPAPRLAVAAAAREEWAGGVCAAARVEGAVGVGAGRAVAEASDDVGDEGLSLDARRWSKGLAWRVSNES